MWGFDQSVLFIWSRGGFRVRTFCEFSSVELTGFELDCDNVAEGLVKELYWDSQTAHGDGVFLS